jgi:hypothetical protein
MFILIVPVAAQEGGPSTWRDPDTRCVYLKIGDTLSLRYRRDGSPDCASVPQVSAGTAVTRTDFEDLARSIEALRRDIGGVRRELSDIRRDLDRRQ